MPVGSKASGPGLHVRPSKHFRATPTGSDQSPAVTSGHSETDIDRHFRGFDLVNYFPIVISSISQT